VKEDLTTAVDGTKILWGVKLVLFFFMLVRPLWEPEDEYDLIVSNPPFYTGHTLTSSAI
jgi:hypothetical protein